MKDSGFSGNARQGREMTVSVAELEDLNAAGACFHSIAKRVGTGAARSGLAILFPHPV